MTSESSIKVLPAGVFIIVGPQTGYWAPCEAHKAADTRRRIYRAVLSILEAAEREPAAADAGA